MADQEIVIEPETEIVIQDDQIEKKVDGDPVQDLKKQHEELQSERTARESAEARAHAAEREAQRLRAQNIESRTQVAKSQLDTVETGINAAKAEADAAKRDLTLAIQAGDAVGQAEAQDRLAQARATEMRLGEAKYDLESRKAAPNEARDIPKIPDDPVEAFAQNRAPQTQKWLREHRDYVTDSRKQMKLNAAHHDAVAEGFTPDTDAYFGHVEKFLGIGEQSAKPAARKSGSPPVAPGGQTASGGSENRNVVKLTRGEMDAATDGTHVWNYNDPSGKNKFKKGDPIGVEEFARRKQKLKEQGAYDRIYTDQ